MMYSKKIVAVAISALIATDIACAAAGNFLLVTGNVQVRDAKGIDRLAVTGSTLDTGETVLTQNGRAQIRFTDSGQISLQPATEFKLADYRYRESGSTEESAVFNLIKGGVRAITGLVGRRTKSDYKMITSTATIGIRGTEFQATLCSASCAQADGLYVQTGEGVITVSNALGEVEVGRGETAFVASPESSPQKTSGGPVMTTTGDFVGPPSLPVLGVGEFQPGAIVITNPLGPATTLSKAGIAAVVSGSLTLDLSNYTSIASANGNATTGSFSGASSAASGAGSTGAQAAGSTAVLGAYISEGQVKGFIVNATSGTESAFSSIVFSSILNAGNSGDLYWGRWSGGAVTLYAGLNGTNASSAMTLPSTASIHYLLSTTVPTVPTTGQATFSFIGGTPSTDSTGALGGGITAGTVTAYFAGNHVGTNFTLVHGATTNVFAYMPMNSGNRAAFSSQNLSGYVSGATGSVAGVLTGSGAPTGAGISYNINGTVGVGAFR
jgi:hypothetical protein